jgi:hypothetical protein
MGLLVGFRQQKNGTVRQWFGGFDHITFPSYANLYRCTMAFVNGIVTGVGLMGPAPNRQGPGFF